MERGNLVVAESGGFPEAKATATVAGEITVQEPDGSTHTEQLGLLLRFASADALRQALNEGVCRFTFGEEDGDAYFAAYAAVKRRRGKW